MATFVLNPFILYVGFIIINYIAERNDKLVYKYKITR